MLKLKRYLKPYIGLLLVAIVLLFGQSMMDLELPNIMSDIVNNGIQKGGITQSAPDAISPEGMQLMRMFMTQDERTLVDEHYKTLTNDALAARQATYPNASESTLFNTLVKSNDNEQARAQIDRAFATASYAFVQVLQQLQQGTGEAGADVAAATTASAQDSAVAATQDEASKDGAAATMDVTAMAQLAPMLAKLPQQTLLTAIDAAHKETDTSTSQTGAVFVKSFYQQLGADTASLQTSYIWQAGLRMLGLCVLITLCAIGAGYCLSRLGAGIARDLRHDVFARVTTFTNNEMDHFSTASLITRTTNDITQIQMFLTMGLRMLCFAPIMGVGGIIMALNKSVSMAWIIALAVVVILGVILVLFGVALPRFKKMQDLVDRLNLVSRENLSGMMVIRAFATQSFEEKRFDGANKSLTNNTLFVNRAMATLMPVMMLVMNTITLLVVWVGAQQISASNMQVGDMMAFMQYAMQVIMSFLFISMMFVMVPRASVSADRIHEVISTPSTVRDPEQPKPLLSPVCGEIGFHNVSFQYAGADENVLQHITFTAKPGETTAFIGSTGSGKSTLINLIPRFYDASEGSITVDGIDIREVTQHDLRAHIGYVPQKGMLFSGDINSNLCYGDEAASEQTLQKAAEVAQATEFIEKLDDGYATPISQGGTNVSGGQRQRLSIARALVKQAPIYIFDDTFSALDFKTDARLRKALKGYTGDATVLIVAQRVSTIMHAEQIVVLDQGRVAGIGTHAELLKDCTTYREIAQSQLSKEELA